MYRRRYTRSRRVRVSRPRFVRTYRRTNRFGRRRVFPRRGFATFVKSVVGAFNFTADSTGPTSRVEWFRLADIGDANEIAGAYQHYKITGIKVEFFPEFNVYNHGNGTSLPTLHTAWDYSRDVAEPNPATVSILEQMKTYKRTLLTHKVSTFARPYIGVEGEADSAGYFPSVSSRNLWLRCSYQGVRYGALLWYMTRADGTDYREAMTIGVKYTYYIKARYER
ncbi:capsid protein [Chicken virus mg4_2302]|nr:capsid protein [Chicken virus mg4_2302]